MRLLFAFRRRVCNNSRLRSLAAAQRHVALISTRMHLESDHIRRSILQEPNPNVPEAGQLCEAVPQAATQIRSLAMPESEDDPIIRQKYRPFLADQDAGDWTSALELDTVLRMAEDDLGRTKTRLRILVLYGSLRRRYLIIASKLRSVSSSEG